MNPSPTVVHKKIRSLEEMRALAEDIVGEYLELQKSKMRARLLLLLDGPMGAGKTQFAKFFISSLGSQEGVSPSFAIHNRYLTDTVNVEHFDLYRLETEDDLESTGFWDFFASTDGIIMIEWASRLAEMDLADQLPVSWPKISIEIALVVGEPGQRNIKIARA